MEARRSAVVVSKETGKGPSESKGEEDGKSESTPVGESGWKVSLGNRQFASGSGAFSVPLRRLAS